MGRETGFEWTPVSKTDSPPAKEGYGDVQEDRNRLWMVSEETEEGRVFGSEEDEKEEEEQRRELQTPKRKMLDFANVLKSFIGSNFLAMPNAFKISGLYLGMILMFVIALVTDHCCKLLVECKDRLPDRKNIRTYGDVGSRVLGFKGKVLVDFFLVFTQFGFCVGYMIFIQANLESMLPSWHLAGIICLQCACIVPWVFVKDVKHFGFSSIAADFCLFTGVIAVFTFNDMKAKDEVVGWNWAGIPMYFGIVTGALEGIGLVLPIEQTMSAQPGRYSKMLDIVMGIVAILLTVFGAFGYLTYGDATLSVITLNLPNDKPGLILAVKSCLVAAIMLTYPLQIYPVVEILESILFDPKTYRSCSLLRRHYFHSSSQTALASTPSVNYSEATDDTTTSHTRPNISYFEWKRNLARTLVVILTALIAWQVPAFNLFVALIGALGSSSLAYILPVIFHIVMLRKELPWYTILKDVVILIFGIAALSVGTYQAVYEIVQFEKQRIDGSSSASP